MAQKARRDRRPPAQTPAADADRVAGSEPFVSDLPIESGMATAAISDVTPAMMEEAAHKAAEAVEAAVSPTVIQAGRDDEEPSGELTPDPVLDPDVVFMPIESQTGNRDAAMPSEKDVSEAMPVLFPPPVESIAASTLVGAAAASIGAEVAAVDEAPSSLVAPTVEAVTAKVEEADGTGQTLRWGPSSPGEVMGVYGAQVVEMVAANIAANSHFLTALMSATSVIDVMALNTSHLRRQLELLTAQRRQLTTLAQTIAFDAMKPFNAMPTDHSRDR